MQHKKKDEAQQRNSEINQLKGLIAQLTQQMQRNDHHLDQESECTEADDNHGDNFCCESGQQTFPGKQKENRHQRAISCATQTAGEQLLSYDQDRCSCCQHECYNNEEEDGQSQISKMDYKEERVPRHRNINVNGQKRTTGGSKSRQGSANPYKRRSSSVISPATPTSSASCCSHSRSPQPDSRAPKNSAVTLHKKYGTSSAKNLQATKFVQLQLQRQQDVERIAELEGFCTELVKQVEHWRRLDQQGRLINAQIEEQLQGRAVSLAHKIGKGTQSKNEIEVDGDTDQVFVQ